MIQKQMWTLISRNVIHFVERNEKDKVLSLGRLRILRADKVKAEE
jgi:hypothetical protein